MGSAKRSIDDGSNDDERGETIIIRSEIRIRILVSKAWSYLFPLSLWSGDQNSHGPNTPKLNIYLSMNIYVY